MERGRSKEESDASWERQLAASRVKRNRERSWVDTNGQGEWGESCRECCNLVNECHPQAGGECDCPSKGAVGLAIQPTKSKTESRPLIKE